MDQKDFKPTHIYYKSTDLDYKTLSKDYKKRSKTTDWLAAPSINYRLTLKHWGMVYRVPLDQKDFRPTQVDYKPIDLDYKLLVERVFKMWQVLPKA